MAWTKKPKLKGSCGIGYQSFNDIRDSLEQLRDDYLVEHSSGEAAQQPAGLHPTVTPGGLVPGISPIQLVAPGRHNSPHIAVGVAHIAYDLTTDTTAPTFRWGSSEVFVNITRLSQGVHLVGLRGVQGVAGRVSFRQAANTLAYQSYCVPVGAGLQVFLYSNSGGASALADSIEYTLYVFRTTAMAYDSPAF